MQSHRPRRKASHLIINNRVVRLLYVDSLVRFPLFQFSFFQSLVNSFLMPPSLIIVCWMSVSSSLTKLFPKSSSFASLRQRYGFGLSLHLSGSLEDLSGLTTSPHALFPWPAYHTSNGLLNWTRGCFTLRHPQMLRHWFISHSIASGLFFVSFHICHIDVSQGWRQSLFMRWELIPIRTDGTWAIASGLNGSRRKADSTLRSESLFFR